MTASFVWLRAMGIGKGTPPHCDIVYMGRGTHRLYTAWIPYGPVSYELGGLMLLEKSHLQAERIRNYLNSDVDAFCTNRPEVPGGKKFNGTLSKNPVTLQEKMGGRWLTEEYQMGDILTFRTDLVHASTDNTTRNVRLSTDTRYQRSDEPIDQRWVGPEPIGHSQAGKRGRIC
ncbi:MAG TPA: phytanoyl-CoA dioxygenase family protein [Chthoniobacterales bacterium]